MRVLFAGVPAIGHLFPLVPLAGAFRERRNDVLFVSLDGGEVVADSGLPYHGVAPGLDWRTELRRRAAAERPELLSRTVETNSADREAFVPLAALVNDSAADAVVEAATEWRPDLVVHDYLFPAASIAAAALGVPSIQVDLGFIRTAPLRRLMLAELAPAFARHGVSGTPGPVAVLDQAPPSMAPAQEKGMSLRPVPYNGDGELPEWLGRPSGRPRVAVTLGTVPPKTDGLTRVDRVVAAAAKVDAEFVLVMGKIDISALGGLPENVRAVGWVPWDRVVAASDAVVHHGGGGTTFTALAAGRPQLVLPDGSDRFANADALRDRGAGLTATADEIDSGLLRCFITDEKLTETAREVALEVAAMPSPVTVATRLEADFA